jgi:hypothetical protein
VFGGGRDVIDIEEEEQGTQDGALRNTTGDRKKVRRVRFIGCELKPVMEIAGEKIQGIPTNTIMV